jgi:glycine reductase complex component B subunit gamma
VPHPIHVLHYINQFFAGIGSESMANTPVEMRTGPVGPGRLLQETIGAAARVKATIVCGDNFFNDERERASARVREILREVKPDVVLAGPAFEAGRYGVACTEVCAIAQDEGIPAVTAMHPENPGVLLHRRDVTIVPTGKSPVEMPAAMQRLALLGLKLARGEALESPELEGYLPHGIRRLGRRDRPGYERAVDMLVAKLGGQPFRSEVPYQAPESVVPAAPVQVLRTASIALVTTGGLVPKGNPEGQTSGNPQRFYGYSVERLERMRPGEWEAYHAGYFTHIVDANPDYVLPLGFLRQLEADGLIGGISPKAYTLPGVSTPVAWSRQLGVGIAEELRKANAGGCILVST